MAHPGESEVILVYKNGDKRLLDKVFVRLDKELLRALEAIVGKENVGTS